MDLPKVSTTTTTTVERSALLSAEQVTQILTEWARANLGFESPTLDFDCDSSGIAEVEVFERQTVSSES